MSEYLNHTCKNLADRDDSSFLRSQFRELLKVAADFVQLQASFFNLAVIYFVLSFPYRSPLRVADRSTSNIVRRDNLELLRETFQRTTERAGQQ